MKESATSNQLQALKQLVQQKIKKREFESAIDAILNAKITRSAQLLSSPDYLFFYLSLAHCFIASNHFEKATHYLKQVLENYPNEGNACLMSAYLALLDNQPLQALEQYLTLLKNETFRPRAKKILALLKKKDPLQLTLTRKASFFYPVPKLPKKNLLLRGRTAKLTLSVVLLSLSLLLTPLAFKLFNQEETAAFSLWEAALSFFKKTKGQEEKMLSTLFLEEKDFLYSKTNPQKITSLFESFKKAIGKRNINQALKHYNELSSYALAPAIKEKVALLHSFIPAPKMNEIDEFPKAPSLEILIGAEQLHAETYWKLNGFVAAEKQEKNKKIIRFVVVEGEEIKQIVKVYFSASTPRFTKEKGYQILAQFKGVAAPAGLLFKGLISKPLFKTLLPSNKKP